MANICLPSADKAVAIARRLGWKCPSTEVGSGMDIIPALNCRDCSTSILCSLVRVVVESLSVMMLFWASGAFRERHSSEDCRQLEVWQQPTLSADLTP